MRKNTPLSQYIRGVTFLDYRAFQDERQKAFAQQRAPELLAFDTVSFKPFLELADHVYQPDTPKESLEDRLAKMRQSVPDRRIVLG